MSDFSNSQLSTPTNELEDIGLFEFLDFDQRLIFVIDISNPENRDYLSIVRSNRAFQERRLLRIISSAPDEFKLWVLGLEAHEDTSRRRFHDIQWTSYTLRGRWKFICGDADLSPMPESAVCSGSPLRPRPFRSPSESILTTPQSMPPDGSSLLETIRCVDWASTPLGPSEEWPDDLHRMFTFLMIDSRPTALYWGKKDTLIYNEGFVPLAGKKHPDILGKSVTEAWPEVYDKMQQVMKTVMATGKVYVEEEAQYFLHRSGYLEECYFTWSFVPLINPTRGFYNPSSEVTKEVISRRRLETLRRISELTTITENTETFWSGILEGLSQNEYDCPFAILYSVGEEPESETSSEFSAASVGNRICFREGVLGIPTTHPIVPLRLDMRRSLDGFAPIFRQALKTRTPTLLSTKNGMFPKALLHGVKWQGFGDPCESAVLCPIRPSAGERTAISVEENVTAFLVLGLNTRRLYDKDYEQWILLLNRQLETAAASIAMFEQEVRSGMNAAESAAREKATLSDKLQNQNKEMEDSRDKELRFRHMVESALVGMFDFDTKGRLVQANKIWYKMTGHPEDSQDRSEMMFMKYVHEGDWELVGKLWEDLMKGTPCSFETRLVGVTGKILYVLASVIPIIGPDGTVESVCGCITDINAAKKNEQDALVKVSLTEQLLAQKTLAEVNEQRFTQFTQYAPIAFSILDPDGLKMQYCNDKWFELTGQPRVKGTGNIIWQDFIIDKEVVDEAWRILFEDQTPQTFEFRLRRPHANSDDAEEETWIQAMAFPELNKDGSIKSIFQCMNDISQFKWAEKVLKLRTEEALESKRQQENFIDMTSHEMRNPLSAVIQCADSIATSLNDMSSFRDLQPELRSLIDESVEAVQTILSCAQHQKRIVDDVLTLSKLDSNFLLITPINVNPVMVLHDAFKMFEVEAQRADVEFQILKDQSITDQNLYVMMDPSRVLQILINLLTNAIKFTAKEEVRRIILTLGASAERPGDNDIFPFMPARILREDLTREKDWGTGDIVYMVFTVEDTGCGISDNEQAMLFNRFAQAHRTHITYGGSGLGLFISRELTELQGGEIGVVSKAGTGSTFSFFVKTRRSVPPENRYLTDASPVQLAARRLSDAIMSTQFNVLVVEDNLVNQRVLKKQLRKLGCHVICANHGAEALEFIQTTTYWKGHELDGKDLSIILLDIEMPVMDGLTCVKRIRELQRKGDICRHIPIIAVSANARIEQINTAKMAGMDDVISKPFRIPDLIPKMERLVKLGRF